MDPNPVHVAAVRFPDAGQWCKVRRPVMDRELEQAWRDVQHVGAIVISLRYSERDHLAVAVVRLGDRRVHSSGYTPAAALDRCRSLLEA